MEKNKIIVYLNMWGTRKFLVLCNFIFKEVLGTILEISRDKIPKKNPEKIPGQVPGKFLDLLVYSRSKKIQRRLGKLYYNLKLCFKKLSINS